MSSFILSPLSQFEVNTLIALNAPILGYFNITLSNLGLYTILTLITILALHIYGNNDSNLIPSK
jgi:F-type H+-transporting ATPase subunit a